MDKKYVFEFCKQCDSYKLCYDNEEHEPNFLSPECGEMSFYSFYKQLGL